MAQAETPRILSRDEFFADELTEEVVPHGRGHVRIRMLTDEQREQITRQAKVAGEVDQERLMKFMVIASLVEPQIGPADYDRLRKKSAVAVADLFTHINRINKFGEEAVAQAADEFSGRQSAAV